MATAARFRELALSHPGTEELPHFDKASFRVKKKIFATLDENLDRAMVKLSAVDQSVFCSFDKTIVYPVPGGWGLKGATYIELKKVKLSMLKDAIHTAWQTVNSGK